MKCRCQTQAVGEESWEEAHSRVAQELADATCKLHTVGAEVERLQKMLDIYCVVHEHNVKLKAENELLRIEAQQAGAAFRNHVSESQRRRYALNRSNEGLSAANALLERWYRDYAKQSNLSRDTKAHLDTQPATAPAGRPLCPRCGWVSTRESKGDEDTYARCKCWEPEGPSHLRSTCTEAEQRVLDACHETHALMLKTIAESTEHRWVRDVIAAELALRKLKE